MWNQATVQSINQKNRLYETLMQTDTDHTDLFNRKIDKYKHQRVYTIALIYLKTLERLSVKSPQFVIAKMI